MKISLRRVDFSDIEFLWYLRNQFDVRKYSKKMRKIPWEEHIEWILPIILRTSGDNEIFIIQKSGKPIGQVRIYYKTFDIAISILKEFRGKGIATKTLGMVIKKIRNQKKAKYLMAQINKNNSPSIKLFEKLGFEFKQKRGNWLKYILEL